MDIQYWQHKAQWLHLSPVQIKWSVLLILCHPLAFYFLLLEKSNNHTTVETFIIFSVQVFLLTIAQQQQKHETCKIIICSMIKCVIIQRTSLYSSSTSPKPLPCVNSFDFGAT